MVRYLFYLGLSALVSLIELPSPAKAADSLFIPDDPLRGRSVFEQKGCNSCHAILGEGAFIGPDLGKKHFYGDFLDLGRVMWNHSPDMTRRMKAMLKPRPFFTTGEIRDLFVYLYYLHYLGEFGDKDAGKRLFKDKGCVRCHNEGQTRRGVPPLAALAAYASPVALAQAMWNHGPAMERQMQSMGISRPRFEGEEVTHLAAYLKSLNGTKIDQAKLMNPGNPSRGETVFREKGCIECHSINGSGGDRGPDLTRALVHRSVTEVAGIMWNHGPAMWKELGPDVQRVTFGSDEMADVIAYLYFTGFLNAPGDVENGARIF